MRCFVECTSPQDGRVYRSGLRVYLVGPETGTPPVYAWREESLRGRAWVSVLLPDASDLSLQGLAAAPTPVRGDRGIHNFLAVHLSRGSGTTVQVGYRWVHRPDVDVPGGYAVVDDLTWVCDAVAQLELDTPDLP